MDGWIHACGFIRYRLFELKERRLWILKEPEMQVSTDARELGFCRLEECSIDDPLRLARVVSENVPCVFRQSLSIPALENWKSEEYLSNIMGEKLISVAVTPNGYIPTFLFYRRADALLGDKFVVPMTVEMTLAEFFSRSREDRTSVYYIQAQNSSLSSEFAELLIDLENGADLPSFAKHIFLDEKPEALNIWIGGERSVTSLHKDHYDNLYAVVTGKKTFKLYPPTDYFHFQEKEYDNYEYAKLDEESWCIRPLEGGGTTPWVSKDIHEIPVEPLVVDLYPGDVLFLPSLW
jgi:jumonji domain-containing protein 7